MSRLYKVFVAPGPEDAALPGASTPWRYPRQVRLPMEHWERMLTLLDGDDFALLDGLPGTDDETARPSPALRATLLRLVERLATAPPLTPDDVDDPEIPEPMPPEVHQQMLRDVLVVLDEAERLGEPFQVWTD